MECLNYRTPQEAWDKEISKYRNKKIPFRGIMSDINNQLSRSEVECVKCSDWGVAVGFLLYWNHISKPNPRQIKIRAIGSDFLNFKIF